MARPIFALLVAAALPFAVLSSSAEGDAAGALAADDECSASDSAACALSELQLKAKEAKTQEAAEASEAESRSEDAAGTARWYLGRVGESCSQACSAHRLACSPGDFRLAANWQQVWSFAAQAGAKCTMSWANDNMHGMGFTVGTPSVCMQTRCGSDLPGTCAYDAMPRSTCDGLPATGFQRLCPCGASSGYSVPAPAPYSYPHSAPAPYHGGSSVPAPAPHYPQSAPAAPCESDTGGTCSWMSCAKSRGDGVSCEKSGGKHKCLCKAGYCAVKGVCKQSYR